MGAQQNAGYNTALGGGKSQRYDKAPQIQGKKVKKEKPPGKKEM